jgi:hypothetical protein
VSGASSHIVAIEQARALAQNGEEQIALSLLGRIITSKQLTLGEIVAAERLEIEILVRVDSDMAAKRAVQRIEAGRITIEDFEMAALCSYNVNDYARAAIFMHRLLDLGGSDPRIKKLGNLIAGQAGDSKLATRLRS